jgi:hypothetical protein
VSERESTPQDEPVADVHAEEVDGIVVESEEQVLVASAPPLPAPHPRGMVPSVQAAAVAAGGFVAGAAVVGLVSRRHSRALAAGQARPRLLRRSREDRVQALQIVSTRSLLVDIHLLGGGEQG